MTPAGLPGFLRRSIRSIDDSPDEDEDDFIRGVEDIAIAGNGTGNGTGVEGGGVSSGSKMSMPVPSSPNAASQKKVPRVGVSEIYEHAKEQQSMKKASASGSGSGSGGVGAGVGVSDSVRSGPGSGPGSNGNYVNETPPNSVGAKFRMVTTSTRRSDDGKDSDAGVINGDTNGNGNAGKVMETKVQSQTADEKDINEESSTRTTGDKVNNNTAAKEPPANKQVPSALDGKSNNNGTPIRKQQQQQQQQQRTKNYKEIEFDKVISAPVVNIADLRRLAWNGIPPHHRPQAWKILLGYLPTNTSRRAQTLKRKRNEYRDAILQHYDIDDHSRTVQEQETLRQVLVDVPRTAPDVPLFRNDLIRQSLARLLYIWAMRHPASSYVQGINDLATPLWAVFLSEYLSSNDGSSSSSSSSSSGSSENSILDAAQLDVELTQDILNDVEADVYWCLTNLLAGIQDHYTSDQPGVQRMVMRLEELVTRMDVGLTQHLETTGVMFMQFAFRWMNCLLLREFNLKCIIRLWDTYLSEGDGGFETFHVYVCAAFLCQFSGQLQGMQFDELFAFMQNIPTSDWGDGEIEIVLSQAFVLSTLFQGSDAHLTSASPRIA